MEETKFITSRLDGMSVALRTQEMKDMVLLRGKAVINEIDKHMTFLQNEPRGPRSVEIGRSQHSRIVRRPDGEYTLTFRFNANERYITSALVAEIREIVKIAVADQKKGGKK